MSVLKKIISTVLLIATLVLALASCNGKNDETVQNNGLINSKYYKLYQYTAWEGSDGYKDFHAELDAPSDMLGEWERCAWLEFKVLNYDEIDGTPLKKIRFDVVTDRDVTVFFEVGYQGEREIASNITLAANQKKTVELPVDMVMDTDKKIITMIFARSNGGYDDLGFGSSAFKEFYQTQYKITNIEFYSK